MSVNTKLTNLANEIREISGTTTKKSLDVMTSDISAANNLIDEQETLLNDLRDIVDTLPEPISGVEYDPDNNGNDGLSIDRSFSYIDIKQENEIYTYADCSILPSGNLRLNEADGTTDLYVNTIFNNIVISADNAVEIRDIDCDLNFDGVNYVVVNADYGLDTEFEINSSFNHMEFNADNRITVYNSELAIASDGSGTLMLKDFSGTASAPNLSAGNIKSGVNILGVTGNYTGSTKSSGSYHIDGTDGYYEYIIPDSAHFIIDCSEYYLGDLDGVAIRINGSTKLCFGNDLGSSGMNIGLEDYEYVHVFIKGSYVAFVSEEGSCYIHDEQALVQGFEIATIANAESVSIYVTHDI